MYNQEGFHVSETDGLKSRHISFGFPPGTLQANNHDPAGLQGEPLLWYGEGLSSSRAMTRARCMPTATCVKTRLSLRLWNDDSPKARLLAEQLTRFLIIQQDYITVHHGEYRIQSINRRGPC